MRKIWKTSPRQRVHLGGGIAHIKAESENNYVKVHLAPIEIERLSDDDKNNGIGFWFDIALYGTFGQHLNFGLDVRYSHAQVNLFHEDVNAGGIHGGLFLGIHF